MGQYVRTAAIAARRRPLHLGAVVLLCLLGAGLAQAQWTNRYPKIETVRDNVGHHLYLEAYNLPTFSAGPTDPAPSADGRSVAFAARGWLWRMDVATRRARRLTAGREVDARPAWSPDGGQIAFVRDDSRDTSIVLIDLATGAERVLVDSPALDLDPAWAPDGRSIFYSSAEAGDLDLWQIEVASGRRTRLSREHGQALNPQPIRGGTALAYVAKTKYFSDAIHTLSLENGESRILRSEGMAPQLRLAAAPDGRSIAITAPDGDRLKLLAIDVDSGEGIEFGEPEYPLTPAWSRDGFLWFVRPTRDESFSLHRVAVTGGPAEDLSPLDWDYGEPTARIIVRTRQNGKASAARLAIVDGKDHPAVPSPGLSYFDNQHGRIFFHSPGEVSLVVPAGTIEVAATRGLDGEVSVSRAVRAGEDVTIDIDLPPGFDAASRGWISGDLHSHLNYGGPYQLEPEDLVLPMRAEGLDVATPQLANLQTRQVDRRFWGWRRDDLPIIRFSQEVRSHFLGHVGVIGADALFHPWFFGPRYPVVAQSDVTNFDALRFARQQGGMNIYVHPVLPRDPFPAEGEPGGMPLELVPDAILGEVDALELACLWSDELGTSQLWYRLLNLGLPIAPSAGSDTMQNIHRMMAIGSTRIYARPEGEVSFASFLDAVRKGRSFVTTGPMIDFSLAGAGPGGVAPGSRSLPWKLELFSPTAVETVEILVNGRVVWRGPGLKGRGRHLYSGRLDLPAGGWVAARVHGGASVWPVQDSYPFAHSAPVWIDRVGSVDPAAEQAAAGDLLRWMKIARQRLAAAYPEDSGRRLKDRFAEAERRLEERRDGRPVEATD